MNRPDDLVHIRLLDAYVGNSLPQEYVSAVINAQ